MQRTSGLMRCVALALALLCCSSSWAPVSSSGTEAAIQHAAELEPEHGVEADPATVVPPPSLLSQLSSSTLHSLRIVASFPHSVRHFTQGLTVDNDPSLADPHAVIELYESTGIWGGTALHKYTLRIDEAAQAGPTGEQATPAPESPLRLQRSLTLPMSVFGEGVCVVDHTLLQLTYQNGVFIQYNKKALSSSSNDEATSDGSPKRTRATPKQAIKLAYPTSSAAMLAGGLAAGSGTHVFKEGWGVTFNTHTRRVVVSDGSSTLFLLRPDALQVVDSTLDVHYIDPRGHRQPVDALNELEYIPSSESQQSGGGDRGEIFANYYESDCILRIDPSNGRVRGVLHADHAAFYSGPVRAAGRKQHRAVEAMNGIAFHAHTQKLLVTGKLWPRIFEVAVDKHPHAPPTPAASTSAEGSASDRTPLGFDLARVCPRASMTNSDMSYWQQVLADTARDGMEDEQRAGEALPVARRKNNKKKKKPSTTHADQTWSAVPPHTQKLAQAQAQAQRSSVSATAPGGAAPPLHNAPRFAQLSALDALDALDEHAAEGIFSPAPEEPLSAETQSTLAEAAESAAEGGLDAIATDFDSRRHVAHEFARMRREERREMRERRLARAQTAGDHDEEEAPRVDFHFIQLGEREVLSGDFD